MSVGEFLIQGYTIRYSESVFSIHYPGPLTITFRVGVLPFGDVESLEIHIMDPMHATVETSISLMRLIYYDEGNDSNGQIEIASKIPDGESNWTTLVNSVPRAVIGGAIAILNGDDDVEQYRVRRNNEGRVIINANDPEGFVEPGGNMIAQGNTGSENVTTNNNAAGGYRRRSRGRRQTRRRRPQF